MSSAVQEEIEPAAKRQKIKEEEPLPSTLNCDDGVR